MLLYTYVCTMLYVENAAWVTAEVEDYGEGEENPGVSKPQEMQAQLQNDPRDAASFSKMWQGECTREGILTSTCTHAHTHTLKYFVKWS